MKAITHSYEILSKYTPSLSISIQVLPNHLDSYNNYSLMHNIQVLIHIPGPTIMVVAPSTVTVARPLHHNPFSYTNAPL